MFRISCFFTFFIIFILNSSLFGQSPDPFISYLKKKLPQDSKIESREVDKHYQAEYLVTLMQPIDHQDLSKGSFPQKIYLSHAGRKASTLIVTEGYSASPREYELAQMLRANQIIVEYRMNGTSRPDKIDFQYLTNDQAMEDLHRIRQIFGKIYKGKWISTGISKGGTTCLIYKSKYPDDVDATVSYVGPLPNAREDERIDAMIYEKLNELPCSKALDAVQKYALKNDDSLLTLIDSVAKADQLTFGRISKAQALEYAVLELTFSFLQLGGDCQEVPTQLNDQNVFNYIKRIVGFDFYAEQTIEYFEPAFYQFMTENGYYGFINKPFAGLLNDLDRYDNEIFAPQGIPLVYDKDYLTRVRVFLYHQGDKIIYIQGGEDPWAACRFVPPAERDALYIELENADHKIRINGLTQDQKTAINRKLSKWLKQDIYPLTTE